MSDDETNETDGQNDAPPWGVELLEGQERLIEATEDLADAVRESEEFGP